MPKKMTSISENDQTLGVPEKGDVKPPTSTTHVTSIGRIVAPWAVAAVAGMVEHAWVISVAIAGEGVGNTLISHRRGHGDRRSAARSPKP